MVVYCGYLLFLLLTLLVQPFPFNKWANKIKAKDNPALLPRFGFFHPMPGKYDYQLYYRLLRAEDSVTHWKKITVTPARTFLSALWNPAKKEQAMIYILADIFEMRFINKSKVTYGPYYQYLLGYIKSVAASPGEKIQFRITRLRGTIEQLSEEIYYDSELHES